MKAKVEESKKTKKLQKEIDMLKKQVHQIRKEVSKASNQREKKYTENIGRYKKERAEIKIWKQVDKIKLVEMDNEHQTLRSVYCYLRQDFQKKKYEFDVLRKEYRRHAAK